SGDGIANNCDPFPATTANATITQCNGSANGGAPVNLKGTATGTKSSAFNVTVYQCNNSTNGGGALVICSANIINQIASSSTAPTVPAPSTSTLVDPRPSARDEAIAILAGLAFLIGFALSMVYVDRRARA